MPCSLDCQRKEISKGDPMANPYPESIKQIAKALLQEIERHFPGLTTKTFDSFGYPDRKGSPAQERAEMCVYIELMKAGAFNEELEIKIDPMKYHPQPGWRS
jgi:hypothetical protein